MHGSTALELTRGERAVSGEGCRGRDIRISDATPTLRLVKMDGRYWLLLADLGHARMDKGGVQKAPRVIFRPGQQPETVT